MRALAASEQHSECVDARQGKDRRGLRRSGRALRDVGRLALAHHELQDEVFGAAGLVVRCKDFEELEQVIDALEASLPSRCMSTPAISTTLADSSRNLRCLAGRLLVNGFGTGVEVSHATVHGGPYPAQPMYIHLRRYACDLPVPATGVLPGLPGGDPSGSAAVAIDARCGTKYRETWLEQPCSRSAGSPGTASANIEAMSAGFICISSEARLLQVERLVRQTSCEAHRFQMALVPFSKASSPIRRP